MPVMFGHVVWVNEYIIQIDHDANIQKIVENVIYELLESYGSIGKTKEYYRLLKWSIIYLKSSLPLITSGNVN